TFAVGAKCARLPVNRSSKRAPILIKKSLSYIAKFDAYDPFIPPIPNDNGLVPGNVPKPCNVFTTGESYFATDCFNSSVAPENCTPAPAMTTGRFALLSASASRIICNGFGFVVG